MMKKCYKWQGDPSWLLIISVPHTFLCSYYFQAPQLRRQAKAKFMKNNLLLLLLLLLLLFLCSPN